jgi:hypothetical protein
MSSKSVTELFNDKRQEWQDFYNYDRPHGSLDGQTPTNDSAGRPPKQRPRVNDLRQLHTTPSWSAAVGAAASAAAG